tara:strand:- start:345 stop:1301 length:957 start_codon:yes stop_codon:yes gene_type:complete
VTGSSSHNNSKPAGSLEKNLATLLLQSASTIYNDTPIVHPVVCMNAIKNILGDVRDSPSEILLTYASNYIAGLKPRKKDQKVLEDMPEDGIGLSIFISDLEDACQQGDAVQVQEEAARVYLAADGSPAILEILAELALQNVEGNGGFIFHCLRAFAFKPEKERVWSFVQCILQTMKNQPLPEPNEGTNNGPNDLGPIFLKCEQPIGWITIAAIWRLWESEYMRLPGFKREISHWISNQNITQNGNPDGSNPDNMIKFRKKGGNYFVKLAENIIQSKNQVLERLAALEAIRFFVKKMPIDCLPIVAKKINFLMNNNESR